MKRILTSFLMCTMFAGYALAGEEESNVPPVAEISETPDRTWFYNAESVVFSSANSYDTDGNVVAVAWYVAGSQVSDTSDYETCFVLHGSAIGGCHELASGSTTVLVELRVKDNSGDWSPYAGLTYTIQEHKGRKYFITDHIGNVRATVNRDGNILGYDDYYPFGKVMQANNTSNPNDNYKFTGHERDTEASLSIDYMNARTYDPVTGMFMQQDPLADEFPGWTPYHYVHNNPLMLVDPTGMRATRFEGVDVVNPKECSQCDSNQRQSRVSQWWDTFLSTVGEVLKNAQVNINFHFGEDDEITATSPVSQEQSMMANAMLADMEGRAEVVAATYNAIGYVPGGDVAQDLYEGDYLGATLNATTYVIPIGKVIKVGKKVAVPLLGFTSHGALRAGERGFTHVMINEIIEKGTRTTAQGRFGPQVRIMYNGKGVVIDATEGGRNYGKIITVLE